MHIIGLRQTQSAAAIADLVNLAYRGAEGENRWTTEFGIIAGARTNAQNVADIILNKNTRVFASFDEEDAPRCCIVVSFDKLKPELAELGMFAVHPNEQGRGVGGELLKYVENYLAKKVERIILKVVNHCKSLIGFYQTKGYYLTGENTPYPVGDLCGKPLLNDTHLVVMEKIIR